MRYSTYNNLNTKQFEAMLRVDLSSENYKADRHITEKRDGEKWCLTELFENDTRETLTALCFLGDTGTNGKPIPPGLGIKKPMREIRIRVMTRQACLLDARGVKLIKHPSRSECIKPEDKPILNDCIRVEGDALLFDPDTTEEIDNKGIRDAMARRGESRVLYVDYPIDKDGCIKVPVKHAMQLLSTNCHGVTVPEFKDLNTNLKNPITGQIDHEQIMLTNWLYQEVGDDYEDDDRLSLEAKAKSDAREAKAKAKRDAINSNNSKDVPSIPGMVTDNKIK